MYICSSIKYTTKKEAIFEKFRSRKVMGKAELILVANPVPGHLTSIIQLAKALIHHDHQLCITLLVIDLPNTLYIDAYCKFLTDSLPNIQLIHIPQPDSDLLPCELTKTSDEVHLCALFDAYKPLVRTAIRDIITSAHSPPVVGLVVDLFCSSYIDLGDEFGISCFIYSVSGTALLNLMYYMPDRHEKVGREFNLSDPPVSIPGLVNAVPATNLPEFTLNKDGGYDAFVQIARGFKACKGVIYNSFYELESNGVEWCRSSKNPKVYPVGPLLNPKAHPNPELERGEWDEILTWLNAQAESSVVFLCFGSVGSSKFNADQVKKLAMGLEQSGHKFLWSMRVNNLEEMLPEGFLERVEGRGMIGKGWAPQAEILGHKAIGGFVSHCGWNSVIESIWFGVPIAAVPMYAEHHLIAFSLVKELGLAVELKLDYRVNCELEIGEVEKAVRSVMDSENEVKKRVKDMSRIARSVVMEGGSSFNSLSEFIRDVRDSNHGT